MKKIVGILAVAAIATSLFAVDINAHVEIEGSIIGQSGDGVGFMKVKKLDPTQDQPNFTMSVTGDNSGAQLMNYAGTDAHDVVDSSFVEWNLWFKPIDSLKVTVGNYEYKLNNPHFGWWHSLFTLPDYGVAFDFNSGAFSATLALGQNNTDVWTADPWKYSYGTFWFDSTKEGFDKIGNFEAIFTYDLGDAGNIKAAIGKGVRVCPHGFSINNAWKRTNLAFAAGYSNQPWGKTGYFIDVAGVMAKDGDSLKFNELDSQMYFEYHMDALAVYIINCVAFAPDAEKKFKDGFELKVQYAINSLTPYLQIDGYSIMDKKMSIKPHVGGSFGSVSYDIGFDLGLDFNEGGSTTWDVPMKWTISL